VVKVQSFHKLLILQTLDVLKQILCQEKPKLFYYNPITSG